MYLYDIGICLFRIRILRWSLGVATSFRHITGHGGWRHVAYISHGYADLFRGVFHLTLNKGSLPYVTFAVFCLWLSVNYGRFSGSGAGNVNQHQQKSQENHSVMFSFPSETPCFPAVVSLAAAKSQSLLLRWFLCRDGLQLSRLNWAGWLNRLFQWSG